MRSFPPRYSPRRRGSVIALVAVSLVALIGMLAISLDGGSLLSDRRNAQAAADAAALAAASDLYYNAYTSNAGLDPQGTAKASALTAAAASGYTAANSTITVNIPPKSGDHVGQPGFAEVIITSINTRGFSAIFGTGNLSVTTRAVAVGKAAPANVGILVLDPSASPAFTTKGQGNVNVTGVPIQVDSSSSKAADTAGGGKVTDPFGTHAVGDGSGNFNTALIGGQGYMPDPLRYLPVPSTSGMATFSAVKESKNDLTLSPGVYNGGIDVSGKASLTLLPGIYYMNGGGFSFAGQGSLTGNGVMIYNAPQSNSDNISITGQGTVTLTAPTSGIYAGVTLFQDRSSDVKVKVAGNGSTNISGTFYAAGAELDVTGNGQFDNLGSQYVSDTLVTTGNGNVNINYDPKLAAQVRTIALVE